MGHRYATPPTCSSGWRCCGSAKSPNLPCRARRRGDGARRDGGTRAGRSKLQLFGPNPKGILVFDASGQTVQIIVNPGVPKFKINNRLKGTPEENTAAVHGTTATFGTFTVDESSKTITVRNAGGMFPGLAGTDTKRIVTSVTAGELKFTNPATAAGMRADNVWRRAK
jgi:hypothetical protein